MKNLYANIALSAFSLAASILVGSLSASAQVIADDVINNTSPNARFSRAQLLNVKAFKNPLKAPNTASVSPSSRSVGTPGVQAAPGATTSGTRAFGTFSVPYTSKRVSHQPISAVASTAGGYLSATYPYRAIGRLDFSAGFCSASLIRKSVLVTAAHCIQNFGSGASIFSGFTYRPAFYNGAAPYGAWTWQTLVRPASWANGTDVGSGAARDNDLAVIALRKNANNQFIGDITGYFGYGWNNYSFVSSSRTGNLAVAALSTLGFPFLLDTGRILQRTDGPSYLTTIAGAGQIYQGSNLTGGSSGGPWLANFGYQNPAFSGGATAGLAANGNVVVGVTSWGAADPNTPKDNYSSQFRQNSRYPNASYGIYGAGNIGSLLNTLCTARPAGSALTYAQLGYCS
jgi:Trypsin